MAEPEDEPPSVLLPCSICSRTFKPESLQKHIKACEKQLTKKRKVFDSSKQRIQGTELAEFLPTILREKKSEKVPAKKQESKWKEKHLEFVRAIRAARGVEVESTKSVPIPRSNHERCPHCDRNFGPKAFDRHVEWCKEQKARIPKSPGSIQAKERLEARTKYRAPPLAKSKRTLTREKYAKPSQHTQDLSPIGSRSIMTFSKVSQHYTQESKIPETSHRNQGMRNKPKVSASSPSCVLPSGNVPMKRREPSPSPSKRPIRSKNIGKSGLAKQKIEEASHRENTFTSTSTTTKSHHGNERSTREVKPHVVEKSSSEEVYDPYVSAERQMMELLSQGDYVPPTSQQNKNVPSSNSESTPKFPSFESSHKSAFVSPESLRTFPSSKSHYEKGDADKKVYEENYVYKLETANNEHNIQSKFHSTGGKFSADSAYGSLNRRSPGNQMPEKHDAEVVDGERVCRMSSSSSESSLPPLCAVQVVKCEASNPSLSPTPSLAVSASPVTQNVPRMSKFCHECGSKYPVSLAKFCCECGVRRLAM